MCTRWMPPYHSSSARCQPQQLHRTERPIRRPPLCSLEPKTFCRCCFGKRLHSFMCLQPLPSRLQRKNRLKHSNPLFHYGQVVKGPLRAILQYGTYSPIDFGRQHTALRRIKQKIPLGIGRKIPPQPPHDFEIAAQDPLPLVAWKVGEEIRDIVADQPDAHVVPVDELSAKRLPIFLTHHIDGPEVTMEQCFRTAIFFKDLCAARLLREKRSHVGQQPIDQSSPFRRKMSLTSQEGLQAADSVPYRGNEESIPKIAPKQPAFSQ